MRYWWVNQNKTYKAEVGGGYMWSPKSNKDGGFNQFYKNMTEAGVGDIVFSFSNTLIKTVGVVSASARSSEKPKEFGKIEQTLMSLKNTSLCALELGRASIETIWKDTRLGVA